MEKKMKTEPGLNKQLLDSNVRTPSKGEIGSSVHTHIAMGTSADLVVLFTSPGLEASKRSFRRRRGAQNWTKRNRIDKLYDQGRMMGPGVRLFISFLFRSISPSLPSSYWCFFLASCSLVWLI